MKDLDKLERWVIKSIEKKEKDVNRGLKFQDELLNYNRGIQLAFELTLKKIQEIKSKGKEDEKSKSEYQKVETIEPRTEEARPDSMHDLPQEQRSATV